MPATAQNVRLARVAGPLRRPAFDDAGLRSAAPRIRGVVNMRFAYGSTPVEGYNVPISFATKALAGPLGAGGGPFALSGLARRLESLRVSIVDLVLKRPYTVPAVLILICLLGIGAALRMPVDIFPEIDIPVVSVVWTYNGMSPVDMQNRILTLHERQLASLVDDMSMPTARARVWRGMTQPHALERTLGEHRTIYQAIMNRDPDLARSWATVHISGIESWLRLALAD